MLSAAAKPLRETSSDLQTFPDTAGHPSQRPRTALTEDTPRESAKEKWDERGEGAKVCGERRVQSAAEPGASKTTSCAQTPKLLGANVSQSVKDAACLLAVSAENVILGVFAKQ